MSALMSKRTFVLIGAATTLATGLSMTASTTALATTANKPKPTAAPSFTPKSTSAASTGAKTSKTLGGLQAQASGCWWSSPHWWCQNAYAAPVYQAGTTTVAGYMYSTTSWFSCRIEGNWNNSGPHPTRWEWTQADNGAWGWMKDGSIYSETDPLPIYPSC